MAVRHFVVPLLCISCVWAQTTLTMVTMHRDAIENAGSATARNESKKLLSFEDISEWIAAYLAKRAGVDRAAIDPAERFQRLGLDSMGATAMLLELGLILGLPLSPTLAWEHPTPIALARHLEMCIRDSQCRIA